MRAVTRARVVPASGPTAYTGYGTSTPAGLGYGADTAAYTLATAFSVTVPGLSLTKIRGWWDSGGGAIVAGDVASVGAPLQVTVYAGDPAGPGAAGSPLVTPVSVSSIVLGAWNDVTVTPLALAVGSTYYAAIFMPSGRYSFRGHEFDATVTNGPITFPANGSAQGGSGTVRNGAFRASGTLGTPDQQVNASWYGIDVEVSG